jgi:trans-aconitate methyltransferase
MLMTSRWNSSLYDSKHNFVARLSEDLVSEWLKPQPTERILDLGCGTGYLTDKIAAAGAFVLGLDSSAEMVKQAQANYPSLQFIVGDGADFHFETPFDAVFSNAALHWIHHAEVVVSCVYDALKPGGRFVAEFGCKGNVAAFLQASEQALREADYPPFPHPPWYFPSLGEYTSLLEKCGFFVARATQFDRPTPLEGEEGGLNWLHMFGAPLIQTVPVERRDSFMADLEQRLRPLLYQNGQWTADYRRLRILALKS